MSDSVYEHIQEEAVKHGIKLDSVMSSSIKHAELMAEKMEQQGELSCAETIRGLMKVASARGKVIKQLLLTKSDNEDVITEQLETILKLKNELEYSVREADLNEFNEF